MRRFLLTVSALLGFGLSSAIASQPGDGLGAYVGGPSPDSFGSFTNNTMTVGSGFYNANTWTDFENGVLDGGMTFTSWKNWENAVSGGRRLVTIGYPLWDWNTSEGGNFTSCAAGSYDTHFVNLAHTIINSGISHVVLRLAWEFNGSWQAYDGTGTYQAAGNGIFPNGDTAHFKGCWQHFVNAVRTVDTATPHVVLFDFNRTAGCCSGSGEDGYVDDNYYPGDAYVDYIGYDLYDTQSNSSTQSQLAAIVSYMRTNHPTKLISFPEWGVWQTGTSANGQGDDPNYIQIMHDFFVNPANNVAYENYFDDAGDADHDIDNGSSTNFPQSAARFKQLFASPYANPDSMFPGATAPTAGKLAHTVVVMLENHSYNDIQSAIQNGTMPWLASIVNSGALMTNSYAVGHPSEPNYLTVWSGGPHGVTDDNAHALTGPTLKSEGAASSPSVTVTEYYDGTVGTDQFAQHLPQTSFAASPDSGSNGTAFSSFPTTSSGYASLPPLSLVVPSYCHDAHDVDGLGLGCSDTNATELTAADSWMQSHLSGYLTWAYNNNSALVIEFDESQGADATCSSSGGSTCGGHIFTLFAGQGIAPGNYSENFSTAELHTTLASMASITLNGSDPALAVPPLSSIFGSSPPPPPPPPPPATGCASGLAQDTMCVLASSDVCKDSASPPLSQQDAIIQPYVDGTAFGNPFTVTADRSNSNATQEFDISLASVSAASHTIGFKLTNDYFPGCDRNGWIATVKLNGTTYTATSDSTYGTQATANTNGWGPTGWYPLFDNADVANFDSVSVTHPSAPPAPAVPKCPAGLPVDTACFFLSEEITGTTQNAIGQVYVDNVAVGAPITVMANHASAWQEADVSLSGVTAASHAIQMKFQNAATTPAVTKLWVGSFTLNGTTIAPSADSTNGTTSPVALTATGNFTKYDTVTVTHAAPPPPASSVEQWNPSQKNSGLTLSTITTTNDKAAVTGAVAVNRAVFGTTSVVTSPASKVYWELVFGTGSGGTAPGLGLTSSSVANDAWMGAGTDTIGYYGGTSGKVWNNGATLVTGWPVFTVSDNVSMAFDSGNCKFWARVNGGNWDGSGTDNPATNTGGLSVPSAICSSGKSIVPGVSLDPATTADSITAKFASTSWSYTAPSGFTAWPGPVVAQPETLTVNQPPYHGVALTVTGSIANLGSAPAALDMTVNGATAPATCSTLTATGFVCSWTPAAAGNYAIQMKDHATSATSPVVNVVVN